MRTTRRRAIWNGVLMASAMPFFAAYGERDRPLSKKNMILTGSLAGWMLADEVVDQFTGRGGKAGFGRTAGDIWSYLAPVGNGLTAYLLLNEDQHQRFVTGVSALDAASTTDITVDVKVGKKYVDTFKALTDVRAVATIQSGPGSVASASVTNGKLTVVLASATTATRVAWMVDVQPPTP